MKKFAEFWKHDWPMKLVAVGIAVLLWFFVIAQQNPVRVKEYDNIPVTYKGAEQLEDNGLCLSDGIDGVLSYVTVSVEASTDVLQYLSADDITATLDFSDITVAGDYALKIKAKVGAGNIASVSPDEVTVTVENLVTRELPVEVQVIGDDNEGLYYGNIQVSTDTVSVSGTQTDVEDFTKALVVIDATHVSSTVTESKTVSLLTEDGKIISAEEYERPLPSVIVTMPVYPTVKLDVNQDEILSNISGIEEGYEITEIELSAEQVRVAGPKDVLDSIKSIKYSKINLKGVTFDTIVPIEPEIPSGVVAVVPEKINVKIGISEIKDKKEFSALPIEIRNLDSKFRCETDPESISVTVLGSKGILSRINKNEVVPYVDLSGLGAGTHEVMINFDSISGMNVDFEPDILNVVVQLIQK